MMCIDVAISFVIMKQSDYTVADNITLTFSYSSTIDVTITFHSFLGRCRKYGMCVIIS